jgi:hypothetical protein
MAANVPPQCPKSITQNEPYGAGAGQGGLGLGIGAPNGGSRTLPVLVLQGETQASRESEAADTDRGLCDSSSPHDQAE